MRYKLDARRMLCPMPVIKTQNRIKELAVGDILEIVCTDSGALSDIPVWARIHGHEIVETEKKEGEVVIAIRVKS